MRSSAVSRPAPRWPDLDDRLNDAFAARDPIRGRIVRNEWIALTAASPLDPGDPIWERVGPALSWLDDEDRRDAADRDQRSHLLRSSRPSTGPGSSRPSELERLGQAVLSHGRGMPEALQQRFLSRLKAAETAQYAGVSGSSPPARLRESCSPRAWCSRWSASYLREGEASQAAVSITDLVELGELDRAGEFIQTLEKADPGLLAYPAMIEPASATRPPRTRRSERALHFDKAMREAEQAPLAMTEPEGLETARSLARGETEKQAIARL